MVPALPDARGRADRLLADLTAGRWADACGQFGPAVAARLDPPGLAAAWAQVIGMAGEYQRPAAPRVYQVGDYTLVDTLLYFAAAERVMRVSFDSGGRVAGLFFLPRALAEDPAGGQPASGGHTSQ
jgi:hypothetical protein